MTNKRLAALIAGLIILLFLMPGCAEKGKLVVGTSTDYKPMEFHSDNNEIIGLDIDIANEIASQLGMSLEIKDYFVWDELLDATSSGKIDFAISSMTITPERSQKMLFSSPYFNGGQVIVVKNDRNDMQSPVDLKDKKIAVIAGSTSEKIASEYVQSPDMLKLYEDYGLDLSILLNGTVDAVIMDYVAAVDFVKISSGKLKIVGEPITQEYYGIATKLGNDALMDEINRILRDMKRTGKLDEINAKWLK